MKVLIFSWRGLGHPRAGGAELATQEHAKYWVGKGNKVTLFTSFFKNGKREETIDGVKVIRRGREILGVQVAAFFWYVFGKHERFDIVVDQFHGLPFFTPLYIRSKKLGYIHEVAKEVWLINRLKFPLNILYGVLGYVGEPFLTTQIFLDEMPQFSKSFLVELDTVIKGTLL